MRANLKHWRDSASLIALARNNVVRDKAVNSNYEILFQKRSDKSGFMPSTIVFPGGTFDDSDADNNWLNHFKSFGIPDDKFANFQLPNTPISLIFQHESDPNLRQIALRITAIRETFEELGVLICKSRNSSSAKTKPTASFMTGFDIHHWQKKVHKDPLQFLTLCKSLDCYPDIWALHLWSNWLTPIKVIPRRFNAIFFMTFFDEKPPVRIDGQEVSKFWWSTPSKVLDSFKEKQLILPTPQWYELSRLKKRLEIETLIDFANARGKLGCELFYPFYHIAEDGAAVFLPGDEFYPENPDLTKKIEVIKGDTKLKDLNSTSRVKHRMIYHDPHTVSYDINNYIPLFSHISPATEKIPILKQKL